MRMLELEQEGKPPATSAQTEAGLLRAVRGLIQARPAEFVQQLGELYLIGTDVQLFSDPHARADLLAVDPQGVAVVVAMERDGEHSLLEHGLMCAGLVAGWQPDFFFLYPTARPAAELRSFLQVPDEQVNRGQRVILLAHSHDFAVYTAAQWLAQRHGIEIWCVQGRIEEASGRLDLARLGPQSFEQPPQTAPAETIRVVFPQPCGTAEQTLDSGAGLPLQPSGDPLTTTVSQVRQWQTIWKPEAEIDAGRSIEGRLQQILEEELHTAVAPEPEAVAPEPEAVAEPEALAIQPPTVSAAALAEQAPPQQDFDPQGYGQQAPTPQAPDQQTIPPLVVVQAAPAKPALAVEQPAAAADLARGPGVEEQPEVVESKQKTRWITGIALLTGVVVLAGIVVLSFRRPAAGPKPEAASKPEHPTQPAAPGMFASSVLDASTGKPIAGARLYYAGQASLAGPDGEIELQTVEGKRKVLVRAPGYRRTTASIDSKEAIRLDPIDIRGFYVAHSHVADPSRRESMLRLIRGTSANAVILGVKDVSGQLNVAVDNPLAKEIGAAGRAETAELARQVAEWKADGIYTVALLALFKDDLLARRKPDLALRSVLSRQPIVDPDGIAWADPAAKPVQDYNIAVAEAAAAAGFDEIHFDFIRYPAEAPSNEGGSPVEYQRRLATLVGFLHKANQALAPYNVYLSASVFGAVCSMPNASVIGQKIEDFAAQVDYISPMLYPSYFEPGQRFPDPLRQSYQLVYENLGRASRRLEGHSRRLRPWLQNFPDSASPDEPLAAENIRNQIKAAEDARASGWMLWDSRNRYRNTTEALRLLHSEQGRAAAESPETSRGRSLLLVAGSADGEPPTANPEGQFRLVGVLLLAGCCLSVLYAAVRASWLFRKWSLHGRARQPRYSAPASPSRAWLSGRAAWAVFPSLAYPERPYPSPLRRAAGGDSN